MIKVEQLLYECVCEVMEIQSFQSRGRSNESDRVCSRNSGSFDISLLVFESCEKSHEIRLFACQVKSSKYL